MTDKNIPFKCSRRFFGTVLIYFNETPVFQNIFVLVMDIKESIERWVIHAPTAEMDEQARQTLEKAN
jgi:hypothetical protein